MKKNTTTKVAALIALVAIFGSVVGTGILILFETFSGKTQQTQQLSQEDLNKLLQQYASSGSILDSQNEDGDTPAEESGNKQQENTLTGNTN